MVSPTEYLSSPHSFVCSWLDVTCIRIQAEIVNERVGDVMMDEIVGINISMFCDLFLFSLSLYRSVPRGINTIGCQFCHKFKDLLWSFKTGVSWHSDESLSSYPIQSQNSHFRPLNRHWHSSRKDHPMPRSIKFKRSTWKDCSVLCV